MEKAAATARHTGATARAILIDDNSKDFLDNVEMQRVAKAAVSKFGGKIDLFGMDACLMNQIEVAYQLRKQSAFIVGSELTEPLDGWPYDRILGKLRLVRIRLKRIQRLQHPLEQVVGLRNGVLEHVDRVR